MQLSRIGGSILVVCEESFAARLEELLSAEELPEVLDAWEADEGQEEA